MPPSNQARASLFIILAILITILIIPPAASQGDVRQSIEASVESGGGNLYIKITLAGDGLKSVDTITANLPEDYIGENDYLKVYTRTDDERAEVEFTYSNGVLEVDTAQLGENLIIEIYKPEAVKPDTKGRYTVEVLTYLETNLETNQQDFEFRPGLDVKGVDEELPPGFSQVRSSPEGVTPEQYQISRILTETELLLMDETEIETFPLQQVSEERVSLLIADTAVEITLDADPRGFLRGVMNLSITNRDLIVWPSNTEIFLNKTYDIVEVKTQLGRPLDYEFTGRVYKVLTPYHIKPNETLTMEISFTINESIEVIPGLTPTIKYNISLPNPTTIPADIFRVAIPDTGYEESVEYYTDYEEDIKVVGEITISLTDIIEDYGLTYILSSIIIIGIAAATYTRIRKILLQDLPEDVRRFIDQYLEEANLMKKILELEKEYSEGRLKDREFLRRRSQLNKEIRDVRRRLSSLRNRVKKLAAENDEIARVIRDVEELEETWKKLNDLEESRRKKLIDQETYRRDREELITRFEILLNKLTKI